MVFRLVFGAIPGTADNFPRTVFGTRFAAISADG
jgi:hypothetical protein